MRLSGDCGRGLLRGLAVIVAGAAALALATMAQPAEEAPRCGHCAGPVEAKLRVVVTDFAGGADYGYCGVACAVREMAAKYPTSRAVARDPFAGKEVRIIRTGVKWVAWPTTAVFLHLPQAKDLEAARRTLAFPRQTEYIQYLATHAEVAAHRPKPLRLAEVMRALTAE